MSQLDINSNQEKYRLNDEEKERYKNEVITFFTTGKSSEKEIPMLYFVSGQTGCGKTEVIKMLRTEKPNQVIYSFDEIRAMHPKFDQASKDLNGDTHAALFPDTDWVCKELLKYCREKRLNVVKEASMRRKEDIIDTARDFKASGYNIDIRLMAVPSIDSYVGTLERYVFQLKNGEPARWITREAHDVTFKKIPGTLQSVMDEGMFDRITIYRRGDISENQGPQEIYTTEGEQFDSPLEALNYGRNNYSESKNPDFWSKVESIIKYIKENAPNRMPELEEYLTGCYRNNTGKEISL